MSDSPEPAPTRAQRKAAWRTTTQARFAICKACPEFEATPKPLETCRACGCLARIKAMTPFDSCPRGRWNFPPPTKDRPHAG